MLSVVAVFGAFTSYMIRTLHGCAMRGSIRIALAVCATLSFLLVSPLGPLFATGSRALEYALTDLGTLGGTNSWAYAINARGQVVGESQTATGESQAFLWEAGIGMQDLGTLCSVSEAFSVNSRGQVAGRCDGDLFLWERHMGMQDLGNLGGPLARGLWIDEQGQILGGSRTASDEEHAFLWEARSGMQDLGTLGGADSHAIDINARGQVVGVSGTATGAAHAFLWEANTGMHDLGTLGGAWSMAQRINARGQVVGSSRTATGAYHFFLWEAGTGIQDLGSLGGSFASVGLFDVNGRGQVVGASYTAAGLLHALIWEAGAGMQDLGSLGGSFILSTASGINARGQIVGSCSTTSYRFGPPSSRAPACGSRVVGGRQARDPLPSGAGGAADVCGGSAAAGTAGSAGPVTWGGVPLINALVTPRVGRHARCDRSESV